MIVPSDIWGEEVDTCTRILAKEIVEKLPAAQKVVVYLHVYLDLHFEEIGNLLGLSKQAVFQRWRRAIDKIKASAL